MHPHRDDEILTYLRSGRVRHRDSEGHTREISSQRLMLMNAGRRFEHEELVQEGGDLTGLQIFLRPAAGGLEPQVQFRDLDAAYSVDRWRLLAGPDKADGLVVRSQSWVHDMRLTAGRQTVLPAAPAALTRLLYVLAGRLVVGGEALDAGDSLLIGTAPNRIEASTTTDLVLFSTDETAPVFKGGMFSGNMNG
jgi:redox-sensitive bicupin YhaK (pirin superfamily)